MELDLTKWVIVTASHGEKYVGQLSLNEPQNESPQGHMNYAYKNREPVSLINARLMLSQYGTGDRGIAGGIQTAVAFIPIDLADGPLEEINVVPSSWYFPPTTPSIIDKFTRLLKAAEDSEENNRVRTNATRAGLEIPGGGRGGMDS